MGVAIGRKKRLRTPLLVEQRWRKAGGMPAAPTCFVFPLIPAAPLPPSPLTLIESIDARTSVAPAEAPCSWLSLFSLADRLQFLKAFWIALAACRHLDHMYTSQVSVWLTGL